MVSFLVLVRSTLVFAIFLFTPIAAFSFDDTPSYTLANGQVVAPLELFRECEVCPEMIVMPLGAFMMGAKRGESRNPFDIFRKGATMRRRGPDEVNIIPAEHPRHKVEMDIPFAIGRNEVTHAEWMACVQDGGCSQVPDHRVFTKLSSGSIGYVPLGPSHPVINVSYIDILEYVAWLNTKVGAEVYRLPTEAEWEYAARAGTQTRFAQGDDLTAEQANFSRRGTEKLRGMPMPDLTNRRLPVPVNTLDAANAWGVRHMSGNVRERTQSCWSEEHLGLQTDSAYLALAQSQQECMRVSKGGFFASAMDYARPASRGRASETYRRDSFGFRIVRQMK